MGRFQAGDRVKILAGHPYHAGRDSQGEEMTGVVKSDEGKVEGRRGKYLVEVDDGWFGDYSFKGRELELIVDVAEPISVEGPAAVAAPVAAPATTAWVEAGKTYRDTDGKSVGPMIAYLDGFIEVAGDGRMWNPDGSAVNEHASLAAPLTLEVGRFYKTRDGRKVGPAKLSNYPSDICKWSVGDTWLRQDNGIASSGDVPAYDIVAEWVEPVAEAEPEVAVKAFTGKGAPGDVVRCDAWDGTLFTAGRVYQFDATGKITSNNGSKFEAIHAGSWTFLRNETVEPVPVAAAEVVPSPKFKLGDKVKVIVTGTKPFRQLGAEFVINSDEGTYSWDGGEQCWAGEGNPYRWKESELALVVDPAPAPEPAAPERKFKVGDRVVYVGKSKVVSSPERIGWLGTLGPVADGIAEVNFDNGKWGNHFFDNLELFTLHTASPTPTGSFIVARMTANGEPRPNVRPRVHASIEAAEQEAQRLADRLGDEFAVYQRVSSKTVDAGPVPEDFDLEQARLTATHKGAVQSAFVWARTKQGHGFWRDQRNTGLTHLGRAILKKWIAEAEAATAKEAA